MHLLLVVGARPNFMKAAPVKRALEKRGALVTLVHTGQHFDANMSKVFFEELALPEPSRFLGVGGTSRGAQFGQVVTLLTEMIEAERPDRVVVVGDVTSTAAGAVAADCADVPVDHIEAGLRSLDVGMPEERNRKITDVLAEDLYVSDPSGLEHLRREGRSDRDIHFVGNVMIDTLEAHLERAAAGAPWGTYGLTPGQYAVFTAHRPANVDSPAELEHLVAILKATLEHMPVVFPIHPRTRKRLADADARILEAPGLTVCEPLGYLAFLGLTSRARAIVTDSGGLQEEATVLNVPCLVMRPNTERPAALVEHGGSGTLVGLDLGKARDALAAIAAGSYPQAQRPALWDGHAADRIADLMLRKR